MALRWSRQPAGGAGRSSGRPVAGWAGQRHPGPHPLRLGRRRTRRLRRLGGARRAAGRRANHCPACAARHDRLARPGPPRRLGQRPGGRQPLAAALAGAGLGAIPGRSLGLGGPVGLDLDRRRALGLCALPLRLVADDRRPLELVARPAPLPAALRAGAERVGAATGLRHRRADRRRLPPAAAAGGDAGGGADLRAAPGPAGGDREHAGVSAVAGAAGLHRAARR